MRQGQVIRVHRYLLAEHVPHLGDSVGSVRYAGHVVNGPHQWQNLGHLEEFSEVEVSADHG